MKLATLEAHFSLEGKTALVTGASGGIGRVLAVGLAGAGAALALHGRDRQKLEALQDEIQQNGGKAEVFTADLAQSDAPASLVAEVLQRLGRLDVLVNNAGMNRRKPATEVTFDDYDAIMRVNLQSAFLLCQAAHPAMKKHGGGKIIQVASITSSIGLGSTSVYGMTKAALSQLTKTLAVEWAADNIQVNALAPGFILTPLTEKSLWADEKKAAWLRGRIPIKRPAQPEEMVAAALFMAGPGSSYLTGQTITVDGGALAGGSWED